MDVRCENCQTEYELDGSRLKPGGVTVKCTSCGHMFKVRKRTPSVEPSGGRASRSSSLGFGEEDRTWLIRLEDGEIKTCRELATLQHWIITHEVSRSAEISRTGKKWKKLSDIAELGEFFEVAEEARRRRGSQPVAADDDDAQPTLEWQGRARPKRASTAHPRLVPSRGSGPNRAGSASSPPTAADAPRTGGPEEPEPGAPDQPLSATDTARGIGVPRAPNGSAPPEPPPAEEPPAEPPPAEEPPAEGERPPPAGPKPRRFYVEDEGPSGPTGGLARGVPTDDVAFAGSGFRAPPGGATGGAGASSPGAEVSVSGTHLKRGGGAAWWVLGVSFVVLSAAAAVMYMFVFRADGPGAAAVSVDAGTGAGAPDAVALAAAGDADLPTVDPGALAAAHEAVLTGSQDALADAADGLEEADDHLESVVARSRVFATRAQLLIDLGELEGGPEGRTLREEASEYATEARELAASARELDRDAVGALVATGDALRISGRRARDVRRPLRRAVAEEPDNVDARLALALVLVDEGRTRQAVRNLEDLAERAEAEDPADPRPRLQLALLELERDEDEAAREHVEKVLALAPDHEVARRLAEILEERGTVVSDEDPMPREEDPSGSAQPVSYDGLLDRANGLAERGRCGEAMRIFRSAVDADPSGVEALTGLAYCHLDAREFASAHARFQSALAISSGYQPALYGVAEAYQQQGLHDRAVDAYEHYLELHPNGTRAAMARRQIERLGVQPEPGSGDESGSGNDDGADEPGTDQTGGADTPEAGGGEESGEGDSGGESGAGGDSGDGENSGAGEDDEPFLSGE